MNLVGRPREMLGHLSTKNLNDLKGTVGLNPELGSSSRRWFK